MSYLMYMFLMSVNMWEIYWCSHSALLLLVCVRFMGSLLRIMCVMFLCSWCRQCVLRFCVSDADDVLCFWALVADNLCLCFCVPDADNVLCFCVLVADDVISLCVPVTDNEFFFFVFLLLVVCVFATYYTNVAENVYYILMFLFFLMCQCFSVPVSRNVWGVFWTCCTVIFCGWFVLCICWIVNFTTCAKSTRIMYHICF